MGIVGAIQAVWVQAVAFSANGEFFFCRAIPRAKYNCGACFAGKSVGEREWGAGLTAEMTGLGGVPKLQDPCCDPRY